MKRSTLAYALITTLVITLLSCAFATSALAAPSFTTVTAGRHYTASGTERAENYYKFTAPEDGDYLFKDYAVNNRTYDSFICVYDSPNLTDTSLAAVNDDQVFPNRMSYFKSAMAAASLEKGKTYYIKILNYKDSDTWHLDFMVSRLSSIIFPDSSDRWYQNISQASTWVFVPSQSGLFRMAADSTSDVNMFVTTADMSDICDHFPIAWMSKSGTDTDYDADFLVYLYKDVPYLITVEDWNNKSSIPGTEFAMVRMSYPFSDVKPSAWYRDVVAECYACGFINGLSDSNGNLTGEFGPGKNITRAQVAAILCNATGGQTDSYVGAFSDVPAGRWYTNSVEWCYQNGIVNGVGNGKFNPSGKVTREQLCAMLMNFWKYLNGTDNDPSPSNDWWSFADASKVSAWARIAVGWGVDCGFIGGSGMLNPRGNATRAEAAKMILVSIQYDLKHYWD